MNELEFVYYNQVGLGFPLSEDIKIVREKDDKISCLISNSKEIHSQVVAPEIDFYIRNTRDDISTQITSIKAMYEARVVAYDLAKYFDYEQEVGNLLVVVSNDDEHIVKKLKEIDFKVVLLKPEQISYLSGHIGALHVGVLQNNGELAELKTDQVLWMDAQEYALKISGVYERKNLNDDEIIKKLSEKLGTYIYKNYISYDPSICQYHERRVEICGKCADVCPTVAILKDDKTKHLVFSHIDCESCGGCVSVCPSGSIDFTQMPKEAFYEITRLYKDKIALIIPRKMNIDNLSISLPKNVLPFAIEGEKYLHESHLIALLQSSGAQVIFYTDIVSKGTKDVVLMLNQIYNAKYSKDAIMICMNKDELQNSFEKATFIKNSKYGINEEGLKKREVFSTRLSCLVANDDLGLISTGSDVHYGVVKIDGSKCTLCLSCVGACNVRALVANADDNTLRLNNSICTTCGYCVVSCPEYCIEVIRDEIPLNHEWFKQHIVAKDELFECKMCGQPYATKRSVEKIASIMKPLFFGDEVKLKTLYYCGDCKPKAMFQEQIEKMEGAHR